MTSSHPERQLSSFGNGSSVDAYNPNAEQVQQAIEMLRGRQNAGVILHYGRARINITGTKTDRLVFNFYNGQVDAHQAGWLSDGVYPEDEKQRIRFFIGNGERDSKPLHKTVSVEMAVQVGIYFMQYQDVPRGLRWYGTMNQYRFPAVYLENFHSDTHQAVEIASVTDIEHIIRQADGQNAIAVVITLTPGSRFARCLLICRSEDNTRFIVRQMDYGFLGNLLDTTIDHSQHGCQVDFYDGQPNCVDIWQSVSLETAIEVASYYYQEQQVPVSAQWG